MTWLWDKVRHSLRNGRLRIRIRKFLEVSDSDHRIPSIPDVSIYAFLHKQYSFEDI